LKKADQRMYKMKEQKKNSKKQNNDYGMDHL